jgi:hypothetical protein
MPLIDVLSLGLINIVDRSPSISNSEPFPAHAIVVGSLFDVFG